MMMAGQCTPHFLFSVAPKRENGPCTVQKRKGAGDEFGREGQIRPRYGGWSEPVPINLANLLPGALDSVPCGGAPPHLHLPTGLFWCVDARPPAPLPALRAWSGTCGEESSSTDGRRRSVQTGQARREAREEKLGALRQRCKTPSEAVPTAAERFWAVRGQTQPAEDRQFTKAPIQASPRTWANLTLAVKFDPSAFSLLDRARPVFSFRRNRKEKMGGALPSHHHG